MIFWGALALGLLALGYACSSLVLRRGYAQAKTVSQIKEEMEVRKSTFSIFGAIAIVFTLGFSLNEFALKQRAEDRQQLYGALGQLIDVQNSRPEISAAALLQLGRLGVQSRDEAPALVRIVTAYLNENARKIVQYHDEHQITRPDLQIGFQVLSDLIGREANLGELVVLRGLDFRHVRLEDVALPSVSLIDIDLSGASLRNAQLDTARLVDIRMEDGDFSNVDLNRASLQFVRLQGSRIEGTNFCAATNRTSLDVNGNSEWSDEKCRP